MIVPYGIPAFLLAYNGPQFVSSFGIDINVLWVEHLTATAYHRNTDSKAERYSNIIVARLCNCMAQH